MQGPDVPTPIDFHDPQHAREWERTAQARPGRADMFKALGWAEGLGPFDAVMTNQAVHELRHKRYAVQLHTVVRTLLAPKGVYLVCDHFFGDEGLANDQLYMTIEEQRTALRKAGFQDVQLVARAGTLAMHRASVASAGPPGTDGRRGDA
jgi:hypothetical protein